MFDRVASFAGSRDDDGHERKKGVDLEKKKASRLPVPNKDRRSECYHINGGDPAEETPPSRRTTVNKRGHVDDVQNHQQRRDNGTGIANNRSVSAQCCQSSEMNEKKQGIYIWRVCLPSRCCWTLGITALMLDRREQLFSILARHSFTHAAADAEAMPSNDSKGRPFRQYQHDVGCFFLRWRGFFHSDWLIPSVVSHLS